MNDDRASDGSTAGMPLSPHLFNPVGRLWAFLVSVQTRGAAASPASAAVADYLALGATSPLLPAAMAAVLRLPEQARNVLVSTPSASVLPADELEVALAEARRATAVLARPGSRLGEVRERFGPAALATLKAASAGLIGTGRGAPVGAGAALAEVRLQALALAAANEAPDGVGRLQDRITRLLDAIRIFPLTGPAGITDEIAGIAGPVTIAPAAGTTAAPRLDAARAALLESLRAFQHQG